MVRNRYNRIPHPTSRYQTGKEQKQLRRNKVKQHNREVKTAQQRQDSTFPNRWTPRYPKQKEQIVKGKQKADEWWQLEQPTTEAPHWNDQ